MVSVRDGRFGGGAAIQNTGNGEMGKLYPFSHQNGAKTLPGEAYKRVWGVPPGTPIHSAGLPPGLRPRFWVSRPVSVTKVFAYRKFKTIEFCWLRSLDKFERWSRLVWLIMRSFRKDGNRRHLTVFTKWSLTGSGRSRKGSKRRET